MASVISMKALLESGVHFGHRTNKWHPAMKPYIFTERNGIHIIDLQQTVKAINTAYGIVRDAVAQGGVVMFIGTKRQAQETVRDEAVRCGMPYVVERWMGGMITNWATIYKRVQEMERLEQLRDTGEIARFTKKEGLLIEREINRLQTRLNGVRAMKRVPNLVFVIDVTREATAIHEANVLGIPVVALVDTNCDPRPIDYVIPSNDDAIRAIKLLVAKIADAVEEGKAMRKDELTEAEEVAAGAAQPAHGAERGHFMEEEMDDKDLLGAATLAKISVSVPAVEEPKVEAEVEPVVETKVETVVEAEAKPEAEAEVKAEVETKVEAEVEPEVETKVETEVEPEVETKVETKVEPEVEEEAEEEAEEEK
jgi:small subunit ribosomal protein S2